MAGLLHSLYVSFQTSLQSSNTANSMGICRGVVANFVSLAFEYFSSRICQIQPGICMPFYSVRDSVASYTCMTVSRLVTHMDLNRVVELNIAIIVCSVPGWSSKVF
jgi:hypothetical protein